MNQPKIKNTMVLVELEDGSIHQVQIKKENQWQILALVAQLEESINILEIPIEGLYIQQPTEK